MPFAVSFGFDARSPIVFVKSKSKLDRRKKTKKKTEATSEALSFGDDDDDDK